MVILNDLCWTLSRYGRGRVALKLWVAPGQNKVLRRTLADHNIDVSRCKPGGRTVLLTAPRTILRVLGLLGALDGPERRKLACCVAEHVEAHEDCTPLYLERRDRTAEALLAAVGYGDVWAPQDRVDLPGAPVDLPKPP